RRELRVHRKRARPRGWQHVVREMRRVAHRARLVSARNVRPRRRRPLPRVWHAASRPLCGTSRYVGCTPLVGSPGRLPRRAMNVRAAAVAGLFYPESARELADTVDGLLQDARAAMPPPDPTPPRALIVPHAGYMYSGPIAARAYATLVPDAPITRVGIVGP